MKTLYKCDICNHQYEKESDCKECEESHSTIIEVYTIYGKNTYHPEFLDVVFSDYTKARYKFYSSDMEGCR